MQERIEYYGATKRQNSIIKVLVQSAASHPHSLSLSLSLLPFVPPSTPLPAPSISRNGSHPKSKGEKQREPSPKASRTENRKFLGRRRHIYLAGLLAHSSENELPGPNFAHKKRGRLNGEGGEPRIKEKERRKRSKKERESPLIPGGTLRRGRRKGHIYAAVLFQGFAVVEHTYGEKRGGRFWFLREPCYYAPDRSRPRKSATKRFPAKTPR